MPDSGTARQHLSAPSDDTAMSFVEHLEELRKRITAFELDPSNDFRYIPSFMLRGLTRLDLHIQRAGPASVSCD